MKVAQLCLTLCNPLGLDHGILQARLLEWVTFPFSRGSSKPRDGTQVSCTGGRFFTIELTRETLNTESDVVLNKMPTLKDKTPCFALESHCRVFAWLGLVGGWTVLSVPIPWPVRLHATHKVFPKLFLGYKGLIDAIKSFSPSFFSFHLFPKAGNLRV